MQQYQYPNQYQNQYPQQNQYSSQYPSMKWYKAFKIIMLIFAIMGSIGIVFSLLGVIMLELPFKYSGNSYYSYEVAEVLSMLRPTQYLILVSIALSVPVNVLYYLIFAALRKFKRSGVYMIYVLNILLPLTTLASAVMSCFYITTIIEYIAGISYYYRSSTIAGDYAVLAAIITGIFLAIAYAVPLTFNSIYFKRRLHVLN